MQLKMFLSSNDIDNPVVVEPMTLILSINHQSGFQNATYPSEQILSSSHGSAS